VGLAARKTGSEWYELIIQGNRLAVIFLITLFLLNLIKRVEANFLDPQYTSDPVDETTLKAISKLLRISVIITAVLIALQLLGYSISGVLAFGGIGGLAVGFAAKDLLANFFGGLMIYLDRPFSVGEWVRSPDQEIEGTVEDIGWRLTRIRTFDKRPLYVPNAVFNTIALENPSRMHNRRIKETVGVRYCDMDSLKAIVNDIRQMLEDHDEIDNNQTLIVNFNQFAPRYHGVLLYQNDPVGEVSRGEGRCVVPHCRHHRQSRCRDCLPHLHCAFAGPAGDESARAPAPAPASAQRQ